nr:MAG: replication initiator protein [Microvirus sp.]
MSCDSPIQAYAGSVNPVTGKRPLQFTLSGSFSGVRQMLPCGKCAGCRLDRSRQWAVRCMHESKMHAASCFVTLTYDVDNLPTVGSLVPRHLQLFHKRLNMRLTRERGYGIRYYGCGEYGDLNKRPHYHSLIFGFDPPDKKFYSGDIFESDYLSDVWGLGGVKVGALTFESCAYVARYCMKKVDGKQREAGHYAVYDSDGLIHERVPEFPHMSRRPGIGSTYFDKYGSEIAQHDTIIVSGREVPSIRYYDLKIEKLDPARLLLLKRNRRRRSVWFERQVDRRRVKEILRLKRLKLKERKL